MKNYFLLIAIMASNSIYGSIPARGTAGNPTYKQRVETGLHNAGAQISYAAKTAWNSFVSAGRNASLTLQETVSSLHTTNLTSAMQKGASTTSNNIKNLWNSLMQKVTPSQKKFAIQTSETDSLDSTYSPLHTSEDTNLFSL